VEELVVRELTDPTPAEGEALIRVRAAALNGFDPMMMGGHTRLKTPFPMIPCGDGAGEVVAFGDGASDSGLEVGARVLIDPSIPGRGMFGETIPGTCCELLCVPLGNLIPMPDEVTFARAAAIPVAYGTALKMLEDRGDVREAERVLVLGATGGVGCCSVQLARRASAEVIACGRGAWKLDRLREIGAHHVIDTAETDWVEAVWELFGRPRYKQPGGGGVDVVVNYIGGDTWARSLKVLCDGGRMLTCGATAGYDPPTDIRYIWSFEQTILGSDGWTRAGLVQLLEWAASGEIDPVIHAERPLAEAREAVRASRQGLSDRSVRRVGPRGHVPRIRRPDEPCREPAHRGWSRCGRSDRDGHRKSFRVRRDHVWGDAGRRRSGPAEHASGSGRPRLHHPRCGVRSRVRGAGGVPESRGGGRGRRHRAVLDRG